MHNINYIWIGEPTKNKLSAVAGHDVDGPIKMAKQLKKQKLKNEKIPDIYFWCLDDFVNFYKKEFEELGASSIKVCSVEQLLKEETKTELSEQANFLLDQLKKIDFDSDLDSHLESNLELVQKVTMDKVGFKDGFSFFLLLSKSGYYFDTNVFPLSIQEKFSHVDVHLPDRNTIQTARSPDNTGDFYAMYSPERAHPEMIKVFNSWQKSGASINLTSAFREADSREDLDIIDPVFGGDNYCVFKNSYKSYMPYTSAIVGAQSVSGLFYWGNENDAKILEEHLKYGDINQQVTLSNNKAFLMPCSLIPLRINSFTENPLELIKRMEFETNEAFINCSVGFFGRKIYYVNKDENRYLPVSTMHMPFPNEPGLSTPKIEGSLINMMEYEKFEPAPYIVNVADSTLLHQAIMFNNPDTVKMLLDHGARTDLKAIYEIRPQNETKELTPLELARFLKREEIIKLLEPLEKKNEDNLEVEVIKNKNRFTR